MGNRLELHKELVKIFESNNVYYQPPESIKIVYPCIIYKQTGMNIKKANNKCYIMHDKYDITIITRTPDPKIKYEILNHFRMINFDRMYTMNNLNHYTYTLYY